VCASQRAQGLRKITLPHLQRRNGVSRRTGIYLPHAFVTEEEEGMVLAGIQTVAAFAEARQIDRSARRAAELVEAKRRLVAVGQIVEIAVSVEQIVAQKLPQRAVKYVRPTARHEIDHRAARAPVLRRQAIGLDLEF